MNKQQEEVLLARLKQASDDGPEALSTVDRLNFVDLGWIDWAGKLTPKAKRVLAGMPASESSNPEPTAPQDASLKTCRNCGEHVKAIVLTCPECGYRFEHRSGKALASLILSLCIGVLVIPAAILGFLALGDLKKHPTWTGRGMAIAALWICALQIAIPIGYLIVYQVATRINYGNAYSKCLDRHPDSRAYCKAVYK